MVSSLFKNSKLFLGMFSKCSIAEGEFDRDLKLILPGELLLEFVLELTLLFLSNKPISLSKAISSSCLCFSASASFFSLFNSLNSLTSSMFSLRKSLGGLWTGPGGGRVATGAMLSILVKELVLLGGELDLELAAEVFGVLWREVSSLKPRPRRITNQMNTFNVLSLIFLCI